MSLRLGVQRLLTNMKAPAQDCIQRRWYSAIGGPPKNKLTAMECIIYGGGMAVAMLTLPIYSLLNLRKIGGDKLLAQE